MRERSGHGQAGHEPRFNVLHRTAKPYDAHEHASLYAPHKWILKEDRNHMHAVALHYMYYNFCRIHTTLRCTPAMEAGVTKEAMVY